MTTQGKDGRAALLERAIRLKRSRDRSPKSRIPERPPDRPARLGEMQRSLWLLDRLEPDSAAYYLASAYRAPVELSASALERSLNDAVSRHRILRSTFRPSGDGVEQIVSSESELRVERLTAAREEMTGIAVREARRPFDLETGPLVRLLLLEQPAGGECLLVLVLHHILADERSLGLLWRELAEGYEAALAGAPAAPAPAGELAPQYDDYVHWTAGRGTSARETALAYWKRKLDPLPQDLVLPFESGAGGGGAAVQPPDRPPDQPSDQPAGRLLRRAVDVETYRQIQELASAAGTTPFAVLAFAFRLLLQRYCGNRRVAFGTPASTRAHPATADMIGYFLNPIAVEAEIDEEATVEEALRGFAGELRDRLANASVPFDTLVEELAPPRRRGRHPIFQAMFVYQETPPPPEMAGVALQPVTLDLGESKFDLTLFAAAGKDSFEIAVEYRVERFEDVWIERLLGHYETVVAAMVANIGGHRGRPAAELEILGPEEAAELERFEQGPSVEGGAELLPTRIVDRAGAAGASPAVLFSGGDWSYDDLERAGRRIAAELVRGGVGPGDRVALFFDRSPWTIAGILGTHLAGAAYVPLDPAYPAGWNRSVLEDAEVAAVLTRAGLLEGLPESSGLVLEVDALNPAAANPPGVLDLRELSGELPAYVLYTSGSTGGPKGVVVTHDNLAASTAARAQVYGTSPERFLLLPSVAFDSSVAGIFWTLAEGGALVVPTQEEVRDPRKLARLIADRRVTSLLSIPSLYAHLLGAGAGALSTLETAIVAGESCPPQLVEEHFRRQAGTRLFNEYGPTEATVWASVHELRADDSRGAVPVGRPIPGARIEVRDERGRRAPAGVAGEGWILGPTVARGYWRRPELTAERFVAGGYRTGDRLSWTAGGRLLFRGRVDDQVKLRGFRIEPGEIEACLRELSGVADAAVVVRDSEKLVAFLVASEPFQERALRDRLARRLPEHMIPGRFVELPELPRLPNGKLDRALLREMPLEAAAPDEGGARILDDRQRFLVALWEGLLDRAGIGLDDNFFRLGGHSLAVVEMTAAIERDLGVAIAPAEVFQNPTVRELAERIEREGGSSAPAYAHLFPIEPGGRGKPLVFCIPHIFSGMAARRFRGERPVYGLRGVGLRPEGNRGRWRSMPDLGRELADEVLRRFPDEPCIIAGYSFGGTMAVELVRQLEARGVPVERLYLIAPMPLDYYRLGPVRFQLDGLRRPVTELSAGQALARFARDNNPLTRRPYRHAWRLTAVGPWRRLLCLVGRIRKLVGLPLTPRILHADVRLERFRLHARYRPGVVGAPTVVFNAREPETDAAATWRPYFEGPFAVVEIPDPHLGEASIREAKKIILEHLEELGH